MCYYFLLPVFLPLHLLVESRNNRTEKKGSHTVFLTPQCLGQEAGSTLSESLSPDGPVLCQHSKTHVMETRRRQENKTNKQKKQRVSASYWRIENALPLSCSQSTGFLPELLVSGIYFQFFETSGHALSFQDKNGTFVTLWCPYDNLLSLSECYCLLSEFMNSCCVHLARYNISASRER